MNFQRRLIVFLATGFGCGYAPWAPGTLGTVVGLPLWYGLAHLSLPWAIGGGACFIAVAIGIAGAAERELGQKDPGCIVIDEMAGVVVTLAGLPLNWPMAIAGFVAFRLFDIWKPFPIRQIECRSAGGFGIVIDDVVAGIMGNICLRIMLEVIAI